MVSQEEDDGGGGGEAAQPRGGDAHDAELLALLRGVSGRSTRSRFGGGGAADGADEEENDKGISEPTAADEPPASPSAGTHRSTSKGEAAAAEEDAHGAISDQSAGNDDKGRGSDGGGAAAAGGGDDEEEDPFDEDAFLPNAANADGGGGNRSSSSGCGGGNDGSDGVRSGGEAQDEAPPVLAEPKAVSSGASTSTAGNSTQDPEPPSCAAAANAATDGRGGGNEGEGGGFQSTQTFAGERGGSAEDAELLALLRGVSSKSSSNGRFGSSTGDGGDGDDDDDTGAGSSGGGGARSAPGAIDAKATGASPSTSERVDTAGEVAESALPPWKRGKRVSASTQSASGAKNRSSSSGQVPPWRKKTGAAAGMTTKGGADDASGIEISVAGSPPAAGDASNSEAVEETSSSGNEVPVVSSQSISPPKDQEEGGFNSTQTFTGERGGAAEDAELLALLRGVSSKSMSSDRFSGGGEEHEDASSPTDTAESKVDPNVVQKKESASLPPWKREKKAMPRSSGSKSRSGDVPPWKKKAASTASKEDDTDGISNSEAVEETSSSGNEVPVVSSQSISPPKDQEEGGFNSTQTFTGERGGSAEDAELLALLRGVSSKSSGGNRFGENDVGDSEENELSTGGSLAGTVNAEATPEPISATGTAAPISSTVSASTATSLPPPVLGTPPQPPDAQQTDESLVTRDTLQCSLASKDWKVRKAAYELLSSILQDMVGTAASREVLSNDIDANAIMPSLDEAVPAMVKDSNAAALDAALKFAILYADHCKGASLSSQASSIIASFYKGSGLSASRPTTAKLSQALPLKLMEVGEDGPSSVHSVVEVLLHQGLASRKPKVVLNSINLVLDAAKSFGAAALPVASVASSAPKILGHSNAKVREAGMNIIAEICRALGSKEPLQSVMATLKPAQMSQLDGLLEKQRGPTQPKIGLRYGKNRGDKTDGPDDVLAALEAGAKEAATKKLASRKAVNIFDLLPKTEYASKLKQAKWSEKTGALDILIQCGGEQPYKLVQPSSSVCYTELIRDLRKLLEHTHFAVNSKAMAAISMLTEGVGEKLFPSLRPMLLQLTDLSKDKKLTAAVGKCLDSIFGNVLSFDHLLDKSDALPTALDERKQKNALARKSTLEFLGRCIERGESAGPRGTLTPNAAENAARLACLKLNDSDAQPRKAAMEILQGLRRIEAEEVAPLVNDAISDLKTDNPRAYKTLTASSSGGKSVERGRANTSKKVSTASRSQSSAKVDIAGAERKLTRGEGTAKSTRSVSTTSKSSSKEISGAMGIASKSVASEPIDVNVDDGGNLPSAEEAIASLAEFGVPNWGADEDDGGVLAGLKSSDWKKRKAAIEALTEYTKSESFMRGRQDVPSPSILVAVKAHTKGFKEVNFNVVKAIMELFLALSEAHAAAKRPPENWICRDAVALSVEKIADRKYATVAPPLLTSLCIVRAPKTVSGLAIAFIGKVKSPIPHEALLKWHQDVCVDFGAAALGQGVSAVVPWILKEAESSNIKVRKMAMRLVGELHSQLGPVFKALILSGDLSSAVKTLVESGIDASPFDPASSTIARAKSCICGNGASSDSATGPSNEEGRGPAALGGIEIPKMDLIGALPDDCVKRMGSKEGKTAWKHRKQALEDVGAALEKCSGLISTSPQSLYAGLVELVRAMKDRLSDSQSNLKPIAAKNIGSLLSRCDRVAQAKLGKLVFGPLINAAMTDNKKMMRDGAIMALQVGTDLHAMEGGGSNPLALDCLVGCLVAQLKDSDFKAGGLHEVLHFVTKHAQHLPKAMSLQSSKSQAQEAAFAASIVACLTSSKSETRAEAEALLKACSDHEVLTATSIQAGGKKLLPAQQRAVNDIIDGLGAGTSPDVVLEKENLSASTKSPTRRSAVARTASTRAPGAGSIRSRPSSSLSRSRPGGKSSARSQSSAAEGLRSSASSNAAGNESPTKGSTSGHPLLSDSPGPSTKDMRSSSLARKRENWPEYPEEPSGSSSFSSLKKTWSHLLPNASVDALFPKSGLQKQDDAEAGCALISRGVELANDADDTVVFDQLDIICKWIACALCSRENTVGLQTLLTLLSDVFQCMISREVQLSDPEAAVLLPILLEKATASKSRFRIMFQDLISQINDEGLYPPQRYGPHICMVVVERTHHAKTRGLAMKECQSCVEKCGLDGIGKKGIQVTAKSFSEETLTENKTIGLDLIVVIIERMGGDLHKFARLCGNSNLSDKAKGLIEERWTKHELHSRPGGKNGNITSRLRRPGTSSTRSSTRSSSGIPGFSLGSGQKGRTRSGISASSLRREDVDADEDEDGFPTLKLSLGDAALSSSSTRRFAQESLSSPRDPFTFQYSSQTHQDVTVRAEPTVPNTTEESSPSSTLPSASVSTGQRTSGVSNLRERLARIRSTTGNSTSRAGGGAAEENDVVQNDSCLGDGAATAEREREVDHKASNNLSPDHVLQAEAEQDFANAMSRIDTLLSQSIPMAVDHPAITSVEESLRTIHAAVSGKGGENSSVIKSDLIGQTPLFFSQMSRALGFACRCGNKDEEGGMCTGLISLLLATLMQVLKDGELAKQINDLCLETLVEEGANLLLDPRITTVGIDSVDGIDQKTREQIQRATNKVAIMAVISAPTHESVIALMSLQGKFCLRIPTDDDGTDKNARLAKIMTKLMARATKSESSKATPFDGFDMEAFLCAVADLVKAARNMKNPQAASSCHMMLKSIITAIIKADGSAAAIQNSLVDCDLTKQNEPLIWELVASCETELGLTPLASISPSPGEIRSACDGDTTSAGSDNVKLFGELIAEGAGATDAVSKQQFKSRLVAFVSSHPNLDVDAHLIPLSDHFRSFILECLGRPGDDIRPLNHNRGTEGPSASTSSNHQVFKDRLDQIKANLQTTEDFVASSSSSLTITSAAAGIPAASQSSDTAVTSGGSTSGAPVASSSSSSTLRARLAASRTATASSGVVRSESNSSETVGIAGDGGRDGGGGGGGAAALRARLNRLKTKKEGTS